MLTSKLIRPVEFKQLQEISTERILHRRDPKQKLSLKVDLEAAMLSLMMHLRQLQRPRLPQSLVSLLSVSSFSDPAFNPALEGPQLIGKRSVFWGFILLKAFFQEVA
jgi:hypothetical protein